MAKTKDEEERIASLILASVVFSVTAVLAVGYACFVAFGRQLLSGAIGP